MRFQMIITVVLLLATILAIGLASPADAGEVWPTNGWIRGVPEQLGIDRNRLQEARDYALTGGGSGFIVLGGKLVMSWGDPTRRFALKSATKSIAITALGLAIKDGKISLDDKARQHHTDLGFPPQSNMAAGWIDDISILLFPPHSNAATGWLDGITILHLATMTAGFDKPGGSTKLLFAPGSKWAYSDSGANWLAECITLAYRQDLNTLMFERVFKPLGIKTSDLSWRANAYRPDKIEGVKRREFGGISANVDAMARIGYLYLRGGKWNGQQIIPQSFVNAVRRPVPEVEGLLVMNDSKTRFAGAPNHYGLLWWNNADGTLANVPRDAYWAWGLYESLIVVIPSLDIVIARAGSAWSGSRNPNYYDVLRPFLEPIVASVDAPIR